MDGEVVSGDAVNLCARVTGTADVGTIRITKSAFTELSSARRQRCRTLGSMDLKGIDAPVEMLEYEWRDPVKFPTSALVEETMQVHKLPQQDRITFGRLPMHDGVRANDIVLSLPDVTRLARISRWHFELQRQADGYSLRPVSEQTTEVDGVLVPRGDSVVIRPGTRVRLGGVMTLVFSAAPSVSLGLATVTGPRDDELPKG
jgi:hypothetical protein